MKSTIEITADPVITDMTALGEPFARKMRLGVMRILFAHRFLERNEDERLLLAAFHCRIPVISKF